MRSPWSTAPLACAGACLAFVLSAGAQEQFGQTPAGQATNFGQIGANQTAALKVTDAIYQGIGFANTFMVITSEGNVIIDTSGSNRAPKHHELLTKVNAAPAKYIILTHGHQDHTGGVRLWKSEGTQIVVQRNFPEFCRLSGPPGRVLHSQQRGAVQL